jgi:isoleucyl-tRNA synthetase
MDKLEQEALATLPGVEWKPKWGLERMTLMLRGRPDWCISRQRTWGVPIPFFIHKDTNELHPKTVDLIEQVAQRVEQSGIDAWFDLDASELLGAQAQDYYKTMDVLDVWFESGLSHYCVLSRRPYLQFPANLYLEGSDQYRGWFQTSLLTSVAIHGVAPYQQTLTHGYTVDGQGRKMSKSLGNVIAPETVIKSLGADILRLLVAASDYSAEMSVTDEVLKRTGELYRRIRNTARFLLSNIHDFDPTQHALAPEKMVALDRWIVSRASQVQTEILALYKSFDFHLIVQKIHHFCSIDLGSFYLDIIKDRQYTCATQSDARRSAQTALYHILEALVRWIAPILSFTADEIWLFMPGKRSQSVHLETWYEGLTAQVASDFDDAVVQRLMMIREQVNKAIETARNQGLLGSALEAKVIIRANQQDKQLLDNVGDELRFLLITSQVIVELHDSDELVTDVQATNEAKCERCWHRAPLSALAEYETICERCVTNITTSGEMRRFA